MPSKSSVSARRASAVGSRPESEYGASCRRDDEASTSAPAAKRVCRKNEIAQLRDEEARLEKQLYELSEYWKCETAKSTVSSEIACSEQRWKQIARCQEELLAESKRESAALRNEYAINRKIVREMRKLVLKRATQHKVSLVAYIFWNPSSDGLPLIPQSICLRLGLWRNSRSAATAEPTARVH